MLLRKIRVRGDHATVTTLSRKAAREFLPKTKKTQKKQKLRTRNQDDTRIVKRTTHEGEINPATYSVAHALAHLLFPKNFAKIIASGTDFELQHARTNYFVQTPTTKRYQSAVKSIYSGEETKHNRYEAKYSRLFNDLYRQLSKAGIYINTIGVNIGVRKNGKRTYPVAFEIRTVSIPKLRDVVENLPSRTPEERLKKKQAMELFKYLESSSEFLSVDTHSR